MAGFFSSSKLGDKKSSLIQNTEFQVIMAFTNSFIFLYVVLIYFQLNMLTTPPLNIADWLTEQGNGRNLLSWRMFYTFLHNPHLTSKTSRTLITFAVRQIESGRRAGREYTIMLYIAYYFFIAFEWQKSS